MAVEPKLKRGSGRPRVDPAAATVDVHLSLSARQYDCLYAIASKNDLSVPAVVRKVLERTLTPAVRNPETDR